MGLELEESSSLVAESAGCDVDKTRSVVSPSEYALALGVSKLRSSSAASVAKLSESNGGHVLKSKSDAGTERRRIGFGVEVGGRKLVFAGMKRPVSR